MEAMGSGKSSLVVSQAGVIDIDDGSSADDSIMLATPSLVTATSASLSSDDDPYGYVGQVTPHRVVSPAVRRVREEDFLSEPGSDDSNMSASPTTDRVARMSQEKTKPCMTMLPRDVTQSPLMLLNSARR